jgi:predicted O-methyltransferase YrrM
MEIRDVPWVTDGANHFLFRMIEAGKINSVLEFGSGASTVFFAKMGLTVVSIEHDPEWYNQVTKKLQRGSQNSKVTRHLLPRPYHKVCDSLASEKFDLVLVDGRDRVRCVEESRSLVKPGGHLMLDNDERSYVYALDCGLSYARAHSLLNGWSKLSYEQRGRDMTGWDAQHVWITTVWQRPL